MHKTDQILNQVLQEQNIYLGTTTEGKFGYFPLNCIQYALTTKGTNEPKHQLRGGHAKLDFKDKVSMQI
jgi:hypothetical protein